MVTVEELEQIALQSQEGIPQDDHGNFHSLEKFEDELGVSFVEIIERLKKVFDCKLIVGNINGHSGSIAAEFQEYGGVEVFATGGTFYLSQESPIPRNRYIIADTEDVNSMKKIPDNAFHLLYSCRGLEGNNDPHIAIPEIHRMLVPKGMAVFDWEFLPDYTPQLERLDTKVLQDLHVFSTWTGGYYDIHEFNGYWAGCRHFIDTFEARISGKSQDDAQKVFERYPPLGKTGYRFEINKSR